VTLACFRIVTRKSGSPRAIHWADLASDAGLRAMMEEAEVRAGLERAVTRGTLLHVWADVGDGPEELYFINTERGREAVRTLQRGERPEGLAPAESPHHKPSGPISLRCTSRTSVCSRRCWPTNYATPRLLSSDVDRGCFPPGGAAKCASWAYVRKILERRDRSEKRGARGRTVEDRRKYIEGEYADLIEY